MRQNLAITLAAVTFLAWTANPARAFNPQPEPPGSEAVGLAFGQTARIQVVNVAELLAPLFPPRDSGTGDGLACSVRLSIFDADGQSIIVIGGRVETGRTVGVELSSRELGIGPGERLVLRGVVQFTGDTEDRVRCQGTTRSSLELFDTRSGRTSLVVPIVTTFLPPDPI